MTVQELGPTAADVQSLRAELDRLLRARQNAAEQERRLTEAVRADRSAVQDYGYRPDPGYAHGAGHAQPPQTGHELLQQLAQAQALREDLGARCLELSDRLLAMEDRLLTDQRTSGRTGAPTGPEARPPAGPAATGQSARPARPARKRPTGARFATAYQPEPEPEPEPAQVLPPVEAPPLRGSRFGGVQAPPAEHDSAPTRRHPGDAPGADPHGPAPTAPIPQLRSPGELSALAQRVDELHRSGAVHESAAVVAQAAVTLAPADVARLVELLRTGGPAGSAGYLARSVAHGAPVQAAGTLAELRRNGQTDEAAALFHALWSAPAAALPALLAALEQAGQSADHQTLLWEWASAPPAELADLALRLWQSGRSADVRNLLRQAAGRPPGEAAAVATALDPALALGLVGEVVRLRQAVDIGAFAAAVSGEADLYGALLGAVAEQDPSRSRSALAALREMGLPTEPWPRTRHYR